MKTTKKRILAVLFAVMVGVSTIPAIGSYAAEDFGAPDTAPAAGAAEENAAAGETGEAVSPEDGNPAAEGESAGAEATEGEVTESDAAAEAAVTEEDGAEEEAAPETEDVALPADATDSDSGSVAAPAAGDTTWQDDFQYTLDESAGTITLNKYTGESDDVTVPGKAVIGGKEYQTCLKDVSASRGNDPIFPTAAPRYSYGTIKFEEGVRLPDDSSYLFYHLHADELDLLDVDTSNVRRTTEMFSYVHTYNGGIVLDETTLDEYAYMFQHMNADRALVYLPNTSSWDLATKPGFTVYTKGEDITKTFKIIDSKGGECWVWNGGQIDGDYTVTFDANGGAYAPQKMKLNTGGHLTLDGALWSDDTGLVIDGNEVNGPYSANKVCIGWNTEPDGSGTFYERGDVWDGTSDMTLYAQYEDYDYAIEGSGVYDPETGLHRTTGQQSLDKVTYKFRPYDAFGTPIFGKTGDIRDLKLLTKEEQDVLITAAYYMSYKAKQDGSLPLGEPLYYMGREMFIGHSMEEVRQACLSNLWTGAEVWAFIEENKDRISECYTCMYVWTDGGDSGGAGTQWYVLPVPVKVGDRTIRVEKTWDDGGRTNLRGEIVIDLFNVKDKESPVKTITLTKDNADPDDPDVWTGVFEDVPDENEDGTMAEYFIRERPVTNYSTTYGVDCNAMKITYTHINGQSGRGFYVYRNGAMTFYPAEAESGELIVPVGEVYFAPYPPDEQIIDSIEYVYADPSEIAAGSDANGFFPKGRMDVCSDALPEDGAYRIVTTEGFNGAGYHLVTGIEVPAIDSEEPGIENYKITNHLTNIPEDEEEPVPQDEESQPTDKPGTPSKTQPDAKPAAKTKAPGTGDASQPLLFAALLLGSGALLAGGAHARRKREKQ